MTYQPNYPMSVFKTETPLGIGGSVDSGVLDLGETQFIESEIYADQDGTFVGTWYADDQTTVLRTFTITYTSTSNLSLYSAPVLTQYLRLVFTNTSGVAQNTFHLHTTKSNISYSGQTLKIEDFLPSNALSQLVRSVNVAKQPDGDYVNQVADGSAFSTSTALGGTMLNGAINDTVTTITVDSTADFPSSGNLKINDEIVTYTGKTATTFTGCTRGAEQTTAASHVDDSDVGEAYISIWQDSDGWNSIELFVKSDVPSQILGMQVQFTDDVQQATPTVRATRNYSFTADDALRGFEDLRISTTLDGFRFIYANGNTSQSEFFLDAVLRTASDNNRYNKGGGLLTSEFDTDVALGLVSNYSIDTKFGRVKLVDSGDTNRDIWAFADDDLSTRLDQKTFPTSASTLYLCSDSTSDTDVDVRVDYLDADGIARMVEVNLNGQTPVSIGFVGIDCNRLEVVGANSAVGNVYCAITNNFTSGLPNTPSDVIAYMRAGYNQTQQAHFTVPLKKRLVIKGYNIGIARSSGAAGSAIATLRIKPSGQASVIKREFFPTTGTPVDKDKANIVVEALSQIVWRLDSVSDLDTNCSCFWDYELIDD